VLLNNLLGLGEEESVFLAEESWQNLIDLHVTQEILQSDIEPDGCIEVKDLGWALHLHQPEPIWLFLTDRYSPRKILSASAGRWGSLASRTVEADEPSLFLALTEYLSLSLAEELFCDNCLLSSPPQHVEERILRLMALLQPVLAEVLQKAARSESELLQPAKEARILEICCGSGMATQALLRAGLSPLVMDYNRCDLCGALKAGLLEPSRSFVLDARSLPQILPARSFSAVLGFMVGLIQDFNWPLWKEILLQAASLSDGMVLFTVYTQREADLIATAFEKAGWQGRVIDNRDPKGIYDQWAYLGRRVG